ncbi:MULTISPECIES: pyridoxal-phosphate dependent enzyme [Rhodomicrobium]|uniref:pyridoxal-phosphate dependent enzyme n=1 Tax=Rhodomicrobium TaxID=1068 RepID=UPI000B4AD771|nr:MULTISPECIES: pyridoxal-phosphate dependent enzyme [Rhodomicrobium]
MDSSPSDASPSTVLGLIGNTPIIRLTKFDTGPCELFLKLESQNPGGSIKDRIALAMVEAAERDGRLPPGGTLVEATAGNTGLALALVAVQKGYRLKLVIPDKMSQEKIFHLKALGAEVVMTRSDVEKGHPDYYQDKARAIAEATPGAFYVNQFENPANPAAHETGTGPEIWRQMDHRLDAIVCGVGSGGTLSGIGHYMARVAPHVEMVLADPEGSILAPLVNEGVRIKPGSWLVEGIGEDFVPDNCDLSLVRRAYTITDAESIAAAGDLLKLEGVLCGSSSGTLLAATLKYCREQTEPKRVLTFACDSGNKYLSKIYNPYWLDDHGMTNRPLTHDLRDLIARPFLRGDVVWSAPQETLQQVYAKMRLYEISQVPVMDGGRLVGLMDEADILTTVTSNPAAFNAAVGSLMRHEVETIDVKSPVAELIPIFERCRAACVVDDGQFLGLITPIDFLNFLRKRTGQP